MHVPLISSGPHLDLFTVGGEGRVKDRPSIEGFIFEVQDVEAEAPETLTLNPSP